MTILSSSAIISMFASRRPTVGWGTLELRVGTWVGNSGVAGALSPIDALTPKPRVHSCQSRDRVDGAVSTHIVASISATPHGIP